MSEKLPDPTERVSTGDALGAVRELREELSCLRAAVGAAELEYQRAIAENDALRRSLREQRRRCLELDEMLDAAKRGRAEISARYEAIALETASLATLYVTSYRLHESVTRDELVTVLREAIISLLGSEAFAIFDVGPGGRLDPVSSMGLEPATIEAVQRRPPLVERCLASGVVHICEDTDGDASDGYAAVVPLRRDGVTEGLIVVFSLLPHKRGLAAADRELLELLSAHAATALYRAGLHGRVAPS